MLTFITKLTVLAALAFAVAVKIGVVPSVLNGLSSNHDHSPL